MKRYVAAGYNLDPTGEISEAWGILENAGVSYETLDVVTSLNGYKVETLNDIARVVFGVDLEDLKSPIDESSNIQSSSVTCDSGRDELFDGKPESLEKHVDLPFDLQNEEVQYGIAEWAVEQLIDTLNSDKKNKRKKLQFWPDDIRWSPTQIAFEVMEGEGNHKGTFRGKLNFYDGPSENYDDVEYLLYEDMKDWLG